MNVPQPQRRPAPKRQKKKVPLWVRILRFFFGRSFRILLLFLLITALVGAAGFLVYTLLCDVSAPWEEIESPATETLAPGENEVPDVGNGFLADLSAYEIYFNPLGDMQNAFLRLVSKEFPLKKNDVPTGLTAPSPEVISVSEGVQLHLYAAKALEAMILEMQAQGVALTDAQSGLPITILSGYRSYAEQKAAYDEEVERQMQRDPSLTKEMAQQLASVSVIPPGLDEFQTGLSVSFGIGPNATSAFANTDAYAWLSENAWKFGFILRYPEDNRPYHFRFVGRVHAELIELHDLTLEEYLDRVKL